MFSGMVGRTAPLAVGTANGYDWLRGVVVLKRGNSGVGRSIPRGKRSSEQMKRTRIMGVCVVAAMAAFALSAIAASSASAGTFYQCRAQKKGEYTTSACSTKSSKPHKGSFELTPLTACAAQKHGNFTESACKTVAEKKGKPDHKGKYEAVSGLTFTTVGGAAKLATPAFGPSDITCTTSTGTGTYLNSENASFRITFEGCSFEGLKCESFGPNSTPSGIAGHIETNLLNAKLIDHGESLSFLNAENNKTETYEPATGEVGLETTSKEHEPYSSELNCGGVVYLRTFGEDTGVFEASSLNHISTTLQVAFEAKKGANGLLTEVLTESGWAGPAPSIEEAGVSTLTNASGVEVKS
jgi:hypothetical protein